MHTNNYIFPIFFVIDVWYICVQSMGKSITMRQVVREAQEQYNGGHCGDPLCDTDLWRVKQELDLAKLRIVDLETQMVTHGIVHRERP